MKKLPFLEEGYSVCVASIDETEGHESIPTERSKKTHIGGGTNDEQSRNAELINSGDKIYGEAYVKRNRFQSSICPKELPGVK